VNTPIGSKEKTDLANLVAENNSYEKWYEVNRAKSDKNLVADAKEDIDEINRLAKEISLTTKKFSELSSKLSKKQNEETRALQKKQEDESNAIYDARKKEEKGLSSKKSKLEQKLIDAGMTNEYHYNEDNDREYTWKVRKDRFVAEYQTWLRELRINILTSITVEEAREHANKFLMK
jgi:hypothetical protein